MSTQNRNRYREAISILKMSPMYKIAFDRESRKILIKEFINSLEIARSNIINQSITA